MKTNKRTVIVEISLTVIIRTSSSSWKLFQVFANLTTLINLKTRKAVIAPLPLPNAISNESQYILLTWNGIGDYNIYCAQENDEGIEPIKFIFKVMLNASACNFNDEFKNKKTEEGKVQIFQNIIITWFTIAYSKSYWVCNYKYYSYYLKVFWMLDFIADIKYWNFWASLQHNGIIYIWVDFLIYSLY